MVKASFDITSNPNAYTVFKILNSGGIGHQLQWLGYIGNVQLCMYIHVYSMYTNYKTSENKTQWSNTREITWTKYYVPLANTFNFK